MSVRNLSGELALVIPHGNESSAMLLSLVMELKTLNVEVLVPDGQIGMFVTAGLGVTPLREWIMSEFRSETLPALVAAINGIVGNDDLDDPLIPTLLFEQSRINHVIAPLLHTSGIGTDDDGLELGKMQIITAALAASNATVIVAPEHFVRFVEYLKDEKDRDGQRNLFFAEVALTRLHDVMKAVSLNRRYLKFVPS